MDLSKKILNTIIDTQRFTLLKNEEANCCVCFNDYPILVLNNREKCELSLVDIDSSIFVNNYIPKDILVKSCCNIHYICIECLHKLVNNYDNHPINEINSHIPCPYPFEECVTSIGFKNIFDHSVIRKICTDEEWRRYTVHAERFAFPGFTIIKCPMIYYYCGSRNQCNSDILVENKLVKTTDIGDLIIECTQNEYCLKRFCMNCKGYINYYVTECHECKTTYENENPNTYNYYLNKDTHKIISMVIEQSEREHSEPEQGEQSEREQSELEINYDQSSYLYKNGEVTVDIAIDNILSLISDINNYMICAICKISLYKTERCNGLSHHSLERCYACGRIGFQVKGLGEHWNQSGIEGCYRFDYDHYIKKYIPEYHCNDTYCSNHEKGDCNIPEHQYGIGLLNNSRKRAYIYHILKSLMSSIRFDVYDKLYSLAKTTSLELMEFLPYKQTFVLLDTYKKRYLDYSEEILYQKLDCIFPGCIEEFRDNKDYCIETKVYLEKYTESELTELTTSNELTSSNELTRLTEGALDQIVNNSINEILNAYRINYTGYVGDIESAESDSEVNNELNEFDNEITNFPINRYQIPPLTVQSYSLLLDIEDYLSDESDSNDPNDSNSSNQIDENNSFETTDQNENLF